MKNLSTFGKTVRKFLLLAVLACPVFVSCYDDSELQQTVDMLVDKVFDLEQKLNDEIAALQGLLEGKIFITEVTVDEAGATNVTLSNEAVLKLLPQKDLKSYVTYVTLTDGTDCWAYIDENGQKQLFLDENNHPIPVLSETPEVITKDDETYLVIGGKEYPLSGNSVFSDYEVITDEETGEVLAVTFTFGETMTFTVTVNSAQGFWFVKENSGQTVKFDRYFVPAGKTVTVQVKSKGVEDYVVQLPYGWKNREVQIAGLDYFQITAPSSELLESGAADSEGNVKVLAVLEGGKASAARLYVSTSPFKTMNVSYGKLTIEPYPGIEEYVYGVCAAADYDKQAIADAVKAGKNPEGSIKADAAVVGAEISTLADLPFVVGTEYVVWALPLTEGAPVSDYTFKYTVVKVSIVDEAFLDATVSLNLGGVDAYYIGLSTKTEYDEANVLSCLNSAVYTARTEPMVNETSLFELVGQTANHSTDYVMWFTVSEDGKKYSAEDLIVLPFRTSTFAAGGTSTLTVDANSLVASPTYVQASVTVNGGTMFFYTFVKADNKVLSGTDEELVDYLLKKGVQVEGTSAVVSTKDEGTSITLKPETAVVLLALGVDADGKYGELLAYDAATSALTFNELNFHAEVTGLDPGDVTIKLTASANNISDYVYWVGRPSDNFWTYSRYLGASPETAASYMALNPSYSKLVEMKASYPVDDDGVILFNDLEPGTNYVFVCSSVDDKGVYSIAEVTLFKVNAIPLGDIVYENDSKWAAAKPTIDFIKERFEAAAGMMPGQYSANVTIPMGFTGYVLLGTDMYFTEGESDTDVTPEDMIVGVVTYADAKRDVGIVVDENAWVTQGYPYGHEFYHFPHGSPSWGNRPGSAVIWGSQEFHDSKCDCHSNPKTTTIANGVEMPVTQVVFINDGKPVMFVQPSAIGSTTEVIDRVFVVCQDAAGNFYQTFEFDVPFEYFRDAKAKE